MEADQDLDKKAELGFDFNERGLEASTKITSVSILFYLSQCRNVDVDVDNAF